MVRKKPAVGSDRQRRRPGPDGLLKNPRPVESWATEEDGRDVAYDTTNKVGPAEVGDSERCLRAYFSKHRTELKPRPRETQEEAARRLVRLTATALSDTGAVWWSGYERYDTVENTARRLSVPWGRGGRRRHVGPMPPARAENKCLWLDTSVVPVVLRRYEKRTQAWRLIFPVHGLAASNTARALAFVADMSKPPDRYVRPSWSGLMMSAPLRHSISRILRGDAKLANQSGRPGYLACATLGALLDRTPEQITDFLANSRRAASARRQKLNAAGTAIHR